jgi:hypothetical protein
MLKLLFRIIALVTFLYSLYYLFRAVVIFIDGLGVTTPDNLAWGISAALFIWGGFWMAVSVFIFKKSNR